MRSGPFGAHTDGELAELEEKEGKRRKKKEEERSCMFHFSAMGAEASIGP